MSLASLVSVKGLAMTATTGLIVIGGGATAAFAGDLPAPLQTVAHRTLGAPAPSLAADEASGEASGSDDAGTESSTETGSETSTETQAASPTSADLPAGPETAGPAASGLCTAYTHGGLATISVAYRNLVTAAGGEDGLSAYCVTVLASTAPTDKGADAGTPRPVSTRAAKPAQTHPAHPTGRPTWAPAGPTSGRPGH